MTIRTITLGALLFTASAISLASGTLHKKVTNSGKSTTYTVRAEDNDWTIARRVGITPKQLRALNPDVNWAKLGPGKKVKIPTKNVIAQLAKPTAKSKSSRVAKAEPKSSSKFPTIRGRYAVISKDGVILRRAPGVGAGKVAVVDRGTPVLVLDRDTHWYKLRFPKGTEAWVRADNLVPAKSPKLQVASAPRNERSKRVAKVETPKNRRVAERTAPGKRSTKTSTRVAQQHTAPKVTSKPSESTRIAALRAERTRLASLRKSNTVNRRAEPRYVLRDGDDNKVVRDALAMQGTRYVWGGASRSGTDCSGLIMQVYGRNGVRLPRTSREMSRVGQKVDKSGLKKGDLVFFGGRANSGVGHVGMYIGDGKFVHASSGKGRVTVSNLSDNYYAKRYRGAKRVIKDSSSKSSKSSKSEDVAKKAEKVEKPTKTQDEDPDQ